MSQHHIYGGSNAAVWSECNGSPYLAKLVEFEPNEAMLRGTRIHERAAAILQERETPPLIPDEEEVAVVYANAVITNLGCHVEIEGYYQKSLEVGGTVDGLQVMFTALHLWDLKTGHTPVSPVKNMQLLNYLWLTGLKAETIHLGIWHEATGEFEWWQPTQEEINEAFAKFEHATNSKKKLTPGPHCAKCKAIGVCNAARAALPVSRSETDIATDYEKIPMWEAVIKGVENAAQSLCADGNLPGYRIGNGRKKALKWLVEPPRTIANVQVYTEEALSPTQVAKLLGKDGETYIVSSALAVRPEPEKVIVKA